MVTHRDDSGHPTAYTADGSMVGFLGHVVPRGRRRSCCCCGAFVSSLSEHVSPEQSRGVPLAGLGPRIHLQPVVRSCLQLCCSGGTSNLGVGAGLQGRRSFSLRLLLSALLWPSCCADSLLWGRCSRRWCGGRGLAERAGLQTSSLADTKID